MAVDAKKLKRDFPIFDSHPKLAYLDSAATSQTPHAVLAIMQDYYERYRSNVHRGLYEIAEGATDAYESARETVTAFIGANSDEVIFTSGATASMNMLVSMLEHSGVIDRGDKIVVSALEHHAVVVPLQELAKRNKCELAFVPLRDDFTLDEEEALSLIDEKTKIVAVTLASNVLGTMPDVKKIGERAREAGALMIVDAAKAAGHFPINVRELDTDFLFFSGHKMCGPTGIGVLYGKKKQLEKLEPGFYGGGMVRSVKRRGATYVDTPERFEAGTPPIAEAIGLAEAIRYVCEIGENKIHEHVGGLVKKVIDALREIDGVTVFAALPDVNAGVVSFSVEGVHPHDVAEILARHHIAVRAGHHCAEPLMQELGVPSVVRASFFLYNTEEDIQKLVNGIKSAQEVFK